MPEGPEIEVFRRGLLPVVEQTIHGLHLEPYRKALNPAGIRSLRGHRFTALTRVGKRLGMVTTGGILVVGAGMSGYWRLARTEDDVPEKHDILQLRLDDHTVTFNDARRFGSIAAWGRGSTRWYRDLGPDCIEPTILQPGPRAAVDAGLARRRKIPIKAALLDQGLLAGIGNIYASEILNVLRVRPELPAAELGRTAELLKVAHRILNHAVNGKGTTIAGANPYRTPADDWTSLYPLRAYAREGQPCQNRGCSGTIEVYQLAGRATYSCDVCQR